MKGAGLHTRSGPKLAVVVPATDAADLLAYCLASLEEARQPEDQIVVVRAPGAPPLPPGARMVLDVAYGGPSAARNAGAQAVDADVLVFVDADVSVAPDFLDRIRELFTQRPDLDGVFGSYDDNVEGVGLVSAFRNLLHHHVHHAAAGEATTFWTGLGAIRRAAFLEVGGLDERLRFLEDIELGARLQTAGARIELDPSLSGTHLKGYSLAAMIQTDLFERGVPWVRLILTGRGSARALNAGPRHRASAGLVLGAGLAAVARRPRLASAFAAAFLGLNQDFHALLRRRLGWRGAVAGPALHALHLAVSISSVPAGLICHVLGAGSGAPDRDRRVDLVEHLPAGGGADQTVDHGSGAREADAAGPAEAGVVEEHDAALRDLAGFHSSQSVRGALLACGRRRRRPGRPARRSTRAPRQR